MNRDGQYVVTFVNQATGLDEMVFSSMADIIKLFGSSGRHITKVERITRIDVTEEVKNDILANNSVI